jgi:hypothetical protein
MITGRVHHPAADHDVYEGGVRTAVGTACGQAIPILAADHPVHVSKVCPSCAALVPA